MTRVGINNKININGRNLNDVGFKFVWRSDMIRNERVVMNYWMVYVSIVHKLGTGTGECPRDSRDDYYRLNHYTKVKLDR